MSTNTGAISADIVMTRFGPVGGVARDGMRQFLGIPYAAPPIGPLRWMPPQDPRPWTAVRDGSRFGASCAQPDVPPAGGFSAPSDTEDCLFINVFAPMEASPTPRPVMVWFPGGGWMCGSASDYDPSYLVRNEEVIFVSLNYRVGLFGFFSHPAINAEGHAGGNFGYMDQQHALRWVQDNIGSFGGDRDNVTIFGESAGAASVWAQLTSPGSEGLFHRAIVQSVDPFNGPKIADVEHVGLAFAEAAGCTDQSAASLRSLSTAQILEVNTPDIGELEGVQTPATYGRYNVGPLTDGSFHPIGVSDALEAGRFSRVPLIVGTTRDELTWFVAMLEKSRGKVIQDEDYPTVLKNNFGDAASEVARLYPLDRFDSAGQALGTAIGDSSFIAGARRGARLVQRHLADVYYYEFDVRDGPMPYPDYSFPLRAYHTGELPFLFRLWHGASGKPQELTTAQAELSRHMVRYWACFAATGNPNTGNATDQPYWEKYDPERDNYLSLRTDSSRMKENFGNHHHCEFWKSFHV